MKYKITLNNKVYEVVVEAGEAILADEYEAAAPAPAAPAAAPAPAAPAAAPTPAAAPAAPVATAAGEPYTAPLPGVIVEVKVKARDAIKAGDVIFIVEAMKMQNELTAPKDCTVAQVVVNKGQTISAGDTLLIMA